MNAKTNGFKNPSLTAAGKGDTAWLLLLTDITIELAET